VQQSRALLLDLNPLGPKMTYFEFVFLFKCKFSFTGLGLFLVSTKLAEGLDCYGLGVLVNWLKTKRLLV